MQQAFISPGAAPFRTAANTTPINNGTHRVNHSSISAINLSFNFLGKKMAAVIAHTSIPNTVNRLDLGWNYLDRLTGTELAAIFNSLPATIHHLTLAGNDFNNLSVLHLQAMQGSLTFIKQLSLSTQEMAAMSHEQLQALALIAPNAQFIVSGQA